jgi:ribose 5-phosphate isomerase B
MFQKLVIASDHGGFSYKEEIKVFLAREYPNVSVDDLGTDSTVSVDYPAFGMAAGNAVHSGRADAGIIICGSGVGISIAANRFSKVRAALCTHVTMARLSREHNDANILALGERIIGIEVALECVRVFMDTEFEGGRHERRVSQLAVVGDQ